MIQANKYANDIIKGKIPACRYVKLACQRHLTDIDKSKNDKYPYYFDEKEAQRYTDFIGHLNLWKSQWANKPVELQGWQSFIIQVLLGWKKKSDGTRRFRKAYIEMARKNAKTTLAAMIGLAVLFIDNESGAQIYSAATKEEQAKIVVTDMAGIINATAELKPYFTFRKSKEGYSRIIFDETYSFVRPLGRDSDTQDGFDPYMGIIDEYHEHKTDGLVNVIESGMGARKEPLLLIITTAGFDKTKPCYSFRKSLTEILEGTMHDESLFGVIYTLDEGDDFKDESVWIKSNPNLSVSVFPEFLKSQLTDALNRSSKLAPFLTKNMNMWVDSSQAWISTDKWRACVHDFNEDDLTAYPCWIGLDLASVKDICALVVMWDAGDKKYFREWFFAPLNSAKLRGQVDGVDYELWASEGHLILTDGAGGEKTDYNYIKKVVLQYANKHNLQSVAYDKWNSSQVVSELVDEGVNMQPYSQSIAYMSYPTKQLEASILSGEVVHKGNPIMEWMMRNVELRTDTNDNVKICKQKSTNKVDGPVAAVMAMGQHLIDTAMQEETYFVV
jgi:phage terminase large subunit-like protein